MALVITITVIDDEDYDGNSVQIKRASVTLDGDDLPFTYSYDGLVLDADIEAAVEADLTARGYSW